ncbi:hypothetical protein IT418_03795 [bacterium]|nr:hypothetical protein [bacterium]
MAQNEKSPKVDSIVKDFFLTVVAVGIVGLTFVSISGLTPRTQTITASNDTAVLGVSTKQQLIRYFPINAATLPFLQDYTMSDVSGVSADTDITMRFTPLEATTYDFTAVTIKNSSNDYKKLRLNPSYSLEGSYTSIKLTYAGQTTEIVSTNGLLTPLDLEIPPSSASELVVTIQPVARLMTPVTLVLGFTEVR